MNELNFTCEACGEAVLSADGALCMKASELHEAMRSKNADKGVLPGSGSDLVGWIGVTRASWRAFHYECVEMEEAASAYQITFDRLKTYRDLSEWTAHLMEKTWFPRTNWRGVLTNQVGYEV